MNTDVVGLVDAGLGNSSYLVDLGDGRALAVDASRDRRTLEAEAARRRLTVAFAADTHLHADFLSAAVDLAAQGATILASAAGGRHFPHHGLYDGDEVDLGGLTLRALVTPGHTDEHLSYELLDGARVVGVFTGGSLIVGAAARTDLLGPERTEELARAQYRSLQRLLSLPDDTAVWPTHGAGSFCSAPPGAERSSTIGRERAGNSLLQSPDEDAFVAALVGSLGSYPPYFTQLAEVNRRGPAVLKEAPPLPEQTVAQLLGLGADVIDVRSFKAHAAGHLPGALAVPLRAAFATWFGWLVDGRRPVVVVRGGDQDPGEIVWQAAKIGMDHLLAGELSGGVEAWTAAGHELVRTEVVRPAELNERPMVLDVRQDSEFTLGHLPGAVHVELGALADTLNAVPPGPVVVMCEHGERASSAASILERAGRRDVRILDGGAGDWAKTTGQRLHTGT